MYPREYVDEVVARMEKKGAQFKYCEEVSAIGKTTDPICYPVVPNLVFTFPRIAQVGVSLDEARKNDKYRVADVAYGQFFLFNTHNEAEDKMAFIFDKESNLLVGAAAIGSDAGAWIDVLSRDSRASSPTRSLSRQESTFVNIWFKVRKIWDFWLSLQS